MVGWASSNPVTTWYRDDLMKTLVHSKEETLLCQLWPPSLLSQFFAFSSIIQATILGIFLVAFPPCTVTVIGMRFPFGSLVNEGAVTTQE